MHEFSDIMVNLLYQAVYVKLGEYPLVRYDPLPEKGTLI